MPAITTTTADAVISEIEISAPADRIFQALTDASQLKRWFSSPDCPAKVWEMEPRIGGRYRSTTEPGTLVVNGVREFECHGEIVEYEPPRLLAYTWFGNWHEDRTRPTIVRWELTPIKSGTHVKVTHSGLAQESVARQDYGNGWPGVMEMLKAFNEK